MADRSILPVRRNTRGSPGKNLPRGSGKGQSPSAAEVWRSINNECVSNGEIDTLRVNMLEQLPAEALARKQALQSMQRGGSAVTKAMPDDLKVSLAGTSI